MRFNVLFVGSKFSNNIFLKDYILREIDKKISFIDSITYYHENDNSIFLHLERELSTDIKLLIITTKQNFSVVGKLLCTVTADNQVLKENMLLPSMCTVFEDQSYLLNYKNSIVNVLHVDELSTFPRLLLEDENLNATIHLFGEDRESAKALLSPISRIHIQAWFACWIHGALPTLKMLS